MASASMLTHPREAEAADGVSEHVPKQRWVGVEGGEVGVHVRALPVCDLKAATNCSQCPSERLLHQTSVQLCSDSTYTGHDDVLDVGEDVIPVLSVLRRMRGDEWAHVAGLHSREDAPIPDVLQIVRDVVHHFFPCTQNTCTVNWAA